MNAKWTNMFFVPFRGYKKILFVLQMISETNWLRTACIAIFVLLSLACPAAHGEPFDKIVADVNGEVITHSELEDVLEPLYRKYEDVYSGPKLFEKLQAARWSMLNQLIEEKLILQEVKKKELEIGEEALMKRMEEVESRFSSREEFQRELARSDMTLDEFRERERERLTAYSLLMEEISRRVMITPQSVISHYNAHRDEFVEPEKVHLFQIFIKKGDDEKLKLAEEVLDRLDGGDDFKELARAYSDGPEKATGGDWGFIERGYLNPDTMGKVEEAAFGIEAGSHSGIVETPLGYHIIVVDAVRKERAVPISEVWNQIERRLGQAEAEKVRAEWISELRKKAYISVK